MSKGIFTDRNHCPSMEEIFAALGPRQKRWEELNHYVRENYQVEGELVFGGANYGWAQRYRRSGKTLLYLFPGRNVLFANVVVGRSLLKKAEALKLGSNARHVLETAKRFYEGCWLYIKVSSTQDFRDIQQLIALKAKPRPLPEQSDSAPRAA
ncbi:MAG: DUF3788 domain-containing protein [Acidobacteriia bacterium]|nr:DUF3788 domain-containing protein [Terriglobia bacterium]